MSQPNILLHDLRFQPYLDAATIQQRVKEIGAQLNRDYADKQPVFLVMLKGAAVFAMDLFREFTGEAELSFARTRSYHGTQSTEQVELLLGPSTAEIYQRDIIIVEDIVDSGLTMNRFLPELQSQHPNSICLVSLLYKPDQIIQPVNIDHIGFSIPPKFVVGYGLDYDGLGRNLPAIYQLLE